MLHDFVAGNRVTLFPDGAESLEEEIDKIAEARQRVWMETYIFEPDAAGLRVLGALRDAASRGVDVILVVDRFGSWRLRDRHVRPLREAGGVAAWFNPFFGLGPHGQKVTPAGLHRDHRKIFIVDDHTAFVGGRNISMDYGHGGDMTFYDVMVEIEGPVVRDLAEIFLETLEDTSEHRRPLFDAIEPAGDTPVRAMQLDLREEVGELDNALTTLVASARHELLFCTPYLIPPRPLLEALCAAASRGVDVRILTAGRSDVPSVKFAGRHLYEDLIQSGARVFEMRSHTLHAKFFVADGRSSIVTSYNADRWGRRYNQEVGVEVLSEKLAEGLSTCFSRGSEVEVTLDTIAGWSRLRRARHALLYGLSRLAAPERSGPDS